MISLRIIPAYLVLMLFLTSLLRAQQPSIPTPLDPLPPSPQTSFAFRETDLLRRDGFSAARQADIVLHLLDRNGQSAPPLKPEDFKLIVNGTERAATLRLPGESRSRAPAVVLLVFPPNQPVLHSIGIRQAQAYFSTLPAEQLPWKVALFDSDGTQTPFTNGRSQLLAYLDISDHKTQPLQYTSDLGVSFVNHWNGPWLSAAEKAVAAMQLSESPKVIIAYNPIHEDTYGGVNSVLANDGPASLIPIAQSIGAHIYIANSGGPEVTIPGGDASQSSNGIYPSGYRAAGFHNFLASTGTAFRSSVIQLTAEQTFGGYSNSLRDLAAQIHRNLDDNYTLTFDLTAKDRDKGVPEVEIRLADRRQRLSIMDLYPLTAASPHDSRTVSKDLMAAMFKASDHAVASTEFRIAQHIDYFPVRQGLQPILPMSAIVQWTGAGPPPSSVSVAEYVQNVNLSTPILEREVEYTWNGRSMTWERDGHLYPGQYLWRIVLHDGSGKVFASAEQKVSVDAPPNASVAISSLVLGHACRDAPASSLRRRADLTPEDRDKIHFAIDPMQTEGCRLKPDPDSRFAVNDSLRALLRIYPTGKLGKNQPETWTATYTLRSDTGAVEFQRDLPFTVDSGSGYLASLNLSLDAPEIQPGPHILDVHVRGPGIRKDLIASRSIAIAAR